MLVAWLFCLVHLVWQVVCCVFFGGSWGFVVVALVFVACLLVWDLPRILRAIS